MGHDIRVESLAAFEDMSMEKTELIESIREINRSAKPEFLAKFSEEDLRAYLQHLMTLDREEATIVN
jgi:hypothetical protein